VALDAASGKVRWYFQLTHHDLWDYDAEAAPSLMNLTRNGKTTPVVVAISKPGLMFFLDRETGKSVYPVEERPVPQSDVPGEETWPTQPFPVKPAPLARLSMKADEVFTGEPEHTKNSAGISLRKSTVFTTRPVHAIQQQGIQSYLSGPAGWSQLWRSFHRSQTGLCIRELAQCRGSWPSR